MTMTFTHMALIDVVNVDSQLLATGTKSPVSYRNFKVNVR